MSNTLHGNTFGLKASSLRMAERLYRKKVPPSLAVTPDLAMHLCQVSSETGRQVGVLVDRRGIPEYVIIGDANKLMLPDIGRLRNRNALLKNK